MEQRIEQLEQQTKKDAERIAVLEQLVHELTLFKDVATAKQQKKKRERNILLAPSTQRFQWCSSIVSDNDEYMEHLSQWMYSVGYRPSELLYCASSHGWKSSDFHRKCDNRGATLTIVKTTGGVIIGGFTVNSWQSDGSDVEENGDKAWLFSLHHPTHGHIRLNYIKQGCVQYNGPSSGPVFRVEICTLTEIPMLVTTLSVT